MSYRNSRKQKVLTAIESLGTASAEEIQGHINDSLSISNIRESLNLYRSQGLVRLTKRARPYVYELSSKGERKLEWLRNQEGAVTA